MKNLLFFLLFHPLSILAQYDCGYANGYEKDCVLRARAQRGVFYPNPVIDELRARNTEGGEIVGKWQVWDIFGKKMKEITGDKVEVLDLPQGTYTVRVYAKNSNNYYSSLFVKF